MLQRLIITAFTATILFLTTHADHVLAQVTPLPYYTEFDFSTTTGWTRFIEGATNQDDFPWYITIHMPYSQPWSLMHTCNTGGGTTVDDWFVSPPFNFSAGGRIDSIRSFLSALGAPGIPGPGDTIGLYLLTIDPDPALASSVTLLHNFWNSSLIQGAWMKTTNINIPPTPGISYIAFRHRAVDNCMNAFFDNLSISGNPTSANPIYRAGADFSVAPNPVTDQLTITTTVPFEHCTIYNATGQKVYDAVYRSSVNTASLPAGAYILELTDKQQRKGRTRIVRQ